MGKSYDPATDQLAFHGEFEKYFDVEPQVGGAADQVVLKPLVLRGPVSISNLNDPILVRLPYALSGIITPANTSITFMDYSFMSLGTDPGTIEAARQQTGWGWYTSGTNNSFLVSASTHLTTIAPSSVTWMLVTDLGAA